MQALSPSKEQHAARRGRERASGYSRPDRTTPRAAARRARDGSRRGSPRGHSSTPKLTFWYLEANFEIPTVTPGGAQAVAFLLLSALRCCACPRPLLARAQAHDAFEGHGALHTSPLPWSCHSRRSRHAGHVDKIISSAPFPGAAGEHAANSQRMPDCGRPTHPDPTSRGKAARFYYEPMIRLQS